MSESPPASPDDSAARRPAEVAGAGGGGPGLLERARSMASDLVRVRRDLHRHPELAFREERTARVLAERLEALGLEVRRGVGGTGLVAEIHGGSAGGEGGGISVGDAAGADGPVVALRADMDALPIQEEAEHDYASTVPGVMHACGHDAHCAGLLGAARLLVALRDEGGLPPGTVRLLFQPAEETGDEEGRSGASRMLEEGALEGADAVVGLHVGGHLPAGTVFLRTGPVMAGSEEIRVEVRGRSAHAARPEEGVDALALACRGVVEAGQVVAERLGASERGVVHFGRIEGGTAPNVLADRVRLHGTLRYLEPEVRERLVEGVRGAFGGLEEAGARVTVALGPGYPPVVNDPGVTTAVRRAAEETAGPGRVADLEPMMLAEDFGVLAGSVPGCFVWLGAAPDEPREHHHPRFDVDESVLPLGAALLAEAALRLLAEPPA